MSNSHISSTWETFLKLELSPPQTTTACFRQLSEGNHNFFIPSKSLHLFMFYKSGKIKCFHKFTLLFSFSFFFCQKLDEILIHIIIRLCLSVTEWPETPQSTVMEGASMVLQRGCYHMKQRFSLVHNMFGFKKFKGKYNENIILKLFLLFK